MLAGLGFGTHLRALAIAALGIVALALQAGYEVKTIPPEAVGMQPALKPNAIRVFRTDGAVPPRGTIVWFEHPSWPGRTLFARVAAGPGDRVAIEAGRVVRDGRALPEDHIEKRLELEDLAEIAVPDGCVYVVNDQRGEAMSPALDSRRLGPIASALVVGWLEDRVSPRYAPGAPGGKQ